MKTIQLISVLLLLLPGCQPKEQEETQSEDPIESDANRKLEKQAWKIHDEVMPKMGSVHKRKTQLKELLTTSTDMDPEKKKEIEETIVELDGAYESMMAWMRNFKPEQHNDTEETVAKYLEGEIESIKKVKEEINTALEKADRLQEE